MCIRDRAQLPPETKAKLLDRKIVSAIKAENLVKADNLISEYQTIGVPVPATYLFIQSKITDSNGEYFRTKTILESYFNSVETSHPKYEEALTLYEKIESKIEAQQEKTVSTSQDAETRLTADFQSTKQEIPKQFDDKTHGQYQTKIEGPAVNLVNTEYFVYIGSYGNVNDAKASLELLFDSNVLLRERAAVISHSQGGAELYRPYFRGLTKDEVNDICKDEIRKLIGCYGGPINDGGEYLKNNTVASF